MADAEYELTTDEVLRAGEAQLRTSREVLSMIDDALMKSSEVLRGRPGRPAWPDTASSDADRRDAWHDANRL